MMWNSARVHVHIITQNAQGVHVIVEVNSTTSFFLSAIYASTRFRNRKLLWNDLHQISKNVNMPWLVVGDFNEVLCQSEKWGGGAMQ